MQLGAFGIDQADVVFLVRLLLGVSAVADDPKAKLLARREGLGAENACSLLDVSFTNAEAREHGGLLAVSALAWLERPRRLALRVVWVQVGSPYAGYLF